MPSCTIKGVGFMHQTKFENGHASLHLDTNYFMTLMLSVYLLRTFLTTSLLFLFLISNNIYIYIFIYIRKKESPKYTGNILG